MRHRIDFNCGHGGAGFQNRQCQRSQAGADFHDMIGSGHSRLAYDTTDRAGVDDEVLPEFLGGADAGIGRDTTDIGGA